MGKDFIYESPDGGKTVYKREMGGGDRELIKILTKEKQKKL